MRSATGCARCCPSCSRSPRTRRSSTGATRGLHSARTQIFTKSFPRCGIPDPFGELRRRTRDYVDFLVRTDSIVEPTQIWWSVRPHHSFGTVEMRICDAQTSADESTALAALIVACVAQAALDDDEGVPLDEPAAALIEENFWRAIRYGLDGTHDRLRRARGVPRRRGARPAARLDRPGARRARASSLRCPSENGAQRQRRALEAGGVDGGGLPRRGRS